MGDKFSEIVGIVQIFAEIAAIFTTPQSISNDATAFLWLLPLVAGISVVYKALKLEKISPLDFLKETMVLAGTIIVFMVIVGLVLCAFTWVVVE